MGDYIERQAVLNAYDAVQRENGPWRFETLIESVPAADVRPVVRGAVGKRHADGVQVQRVRMPYAGKIKLLPQLRGGYERRKRTMTLEQCVEKFLRTVQENPGLPVYCWVDCEVVCGDEYQRWIGEIGDCRVADVAIYDGEWYEDQEELIEAYYNNHDEKYEGWDGVKVDYDIIRRTEHLWHKVILLNVDLPDSTCKGDDEA